MKSEEFIKACEDGKILVWGHEGTRIVSRKEKKFYYLDLETGFSLSFDSMERLGEDNVFMMIGEIPVGVIPIGSWKIIFEKEGKE